MRVPAQLRITTALARYMTTMQSVDTELMLHCACFGDLTVLMLR